jgi:superfamily II DNA/RNA helicase
MLLRHLLQSENPERVLVFVASRHTAERVSGKLQQAGIRAAALHGDCSQGQRGQVLADFKAARLQVLVATDVAARGIDIARLEMVINYDLPRSPADYTHRIGRTGRAGASGVAISFVCADSAAHFRLIENVSSYSLTRAHCRFRTAGCRRGSTACDGNGGIKGKRMSKKDKLRAAQAPSPEPRPAGAAINLQ